MKLRTEAIAVAMQPLEQRVMMTAIGLKSAHPDLLTTALLSKSEIKSALKTAVKTTLRVPVKTAAKATSKKTTAKTTTKKPTTTAKPTSGTTTVGKTTVGTTTNTPGVGGVKSSLTPDVTSSAFTPGDLVAYTVSSSTTLSAAATAVSLTEISPSGGTVSAGSVSLPTTSGSGSTPNPLTAAGSVTTEGDLTLSSNGEYLLVPGYDATVGTTGAGTNGVGSTQASSTLYVASVSKGTGSGSSTTSVTTLANTGVTTGDAVTVSLPGITLAPSQSTYYAYISTSTTTVALYTTAAAASAHGTGGLVTGTGTLSTTATSTITDPNITSFVPREVGLVSSNGAINTTTTLGNLLGSSDIRGAASPDGNGIYAVGGAGIAYTTAGSSSAANATYLDNGLDPNTFITGARTAVAYTVQLNGGQLYVSTQAYNSGTNASNYFETVGTGEPTTGPRQTLTALPGALENDGTTHYNPATGVYGPDEFAFATLNGGSSPDTLYVADNGNNAIEKFSLESGTWYLTGFAGGGSGGTGETVSSVTTGALTGGTLTGVTGVLAQPVNGGEQIFVSTPTAVYSFTDTSGYEGTLDSGNNLALTSLATASGTTKAFRGLAFAPTASTAAPTVTSVVQPGSSTAGGDTVTITGTGFSGATGVSFGGTPGTNITVVSDTQLTVTAPAESAGTVDIIVTNNIGASTASSADHFTYSTTPTVTGISPSSGSTGGGTFVTISGYDFTGETGVNFGSSPATNVTFVNDNTITANAPSGTLNQTVDVTVTNSNSTSATSSADQFLYTLSPSVSSVNPTTGTTAGSTTVTITGTNLGTPSTATVSFGGTAGTITSDNGSTLVATDPAESAGTVDVTVTTSYGTSAIGAGDKFTYVTPATVTSLSSSSGMDVGGFSITVNGTGFTAASTVAFGTLPAAKVTYVSPTQLTVVTPQNLLNQSNPQNVTVDVTVTNNGVSSLTGSADQYTFTPTTVAQAETYANGAVVTIDNDPVVTAVLSVPTADNNNQSVNGINYTYYQIFIQDSTGAIDLFAASLPGGYVPVVGDEVTVTGALNPYHGAAELSNLTALTKVSSGNAVPSPVTTNLSTLGSALTGQNLPTAYDDQLVQLNNVTLSSAPQGNPYQYNSLPPTFGVVSEGGLLADSSTGGNPSSNVTFYYYPSSYSLVNQNFYGTTPNTTSTEDYVGFVQIYPNSASGTTVYQPEFIPIEEVNGSGTPVSPDGMTLTTSEPKISTATLAESDSFYEAQRGDTITAYVTRNSNLPAATVQYSLIPDSAQAGTDYDAGSTAPGTAGTVSFAANQTQATFTVTINSNPGDSGDKDFTIELLNPQETNPNDGYVASLTGGPANVLIKDNSPGQATTAGNVSTPNSSTNENANVGSSKGTIPAAAGKIEIAAPGNLASGSSAPDYALLEFNDGNDASDSLTTQGDTGSAGTIQTIDNIELETVDNPTYYDASGLLNVYVLAASNTISPSTFTTNGVKNYQFQTVTASPQSYSDGVGGTIGSDGTITGSTLGTLYPLGQINYSEFQQPGGYEPFNLSQLNPIGTYQVATDISNGSAFTVVILPGDNNVTADFYSSADSATDLSPILRVNYSNNARPWISTTTNSDGSSPAIWIAPTSTLADAGQATITADPQASGDLPNIVGFTANSLVTISPTASGQAFHIMSVTLTNGAQVMMTPQGTATDLYTKPDVLVVGAMSSDTAPTFSLDATSKVDLTNNDLILAGTSEESTIEGLIGGAWDTGKWDQPGLTSSSAAAKPSAFGLGYASSTEYASQNGGATTFDGVNIASGATIVKFTLLGDTTLTGQVGLGDLDTVLGNFNATVDWVNGDFEYGVPNVDAGVGLGDYSDVLANFNASATASVTSGVVTSNLATGSTVSSSGATSDTSDSSTPDKSKDAAS